MHTTLNMWLTLVLFAFATAGLSHFIQLCLEPGMIFARYGLWLEYVWRSNWRRKDRWKRWPLKPMGLCVYCNSFWVGTIFFLLHYGLDLGLFLFAGIQFVWIKLIEKFKG